MSPLRRIHTAVVAVCRGRIFITMSWGNDIVPAVPRGGAITMAPGHCDYGASHANGGTSPAWSPCDSLWVALALRHRAGEEEGTGDIYSCCIIRSMLHADMDLHNFWCIHKFRCMFCVLSPVAWFAWVWFALSGIIAEFQGHFCAFFFFIFWFHIRKTSTNFATISLCFQETFLQSGSVTKEKFPYSWLQLHMWNSSFCTYHCDLYSSSYLSSL